jgi:hypothetical protein
MFSSRAPKLIGAALMDLAEAMLRPVDADGFEHVPAAERGAATTLAAASRPAARPAATGPTGLGATRVRPDDAGRPAAGDDWLAEQLFTGELAPRSGLAPAPTRTQRAGRRTEPILPRLDRARRPGMVERPEQPCVSPLPRRTAARDRHAA